MRCKAGGNQKAFLALCINRIFFYVRKQPVGDFSGDYKKKITSDNCLFVLLTKTACFEPPTFCTSGT